jgi:WD40 repeat protein
VIPVLPQLAGPKDEPIAANLVATLVHPDRKARIWELEFSPDTRRLLSNSSPSEIVQIWDVTTRKEVQRIDMPRGDGVSTEKALITPDWSTLYFALHNSSSTPLERDGQKVYRVERSGEIRVWDVASGKEKPALRPAEGTAPFDANLAQGGRLLVCYESPGFTSGISSKVVTVVWDLAAGRKWKLMDGGYFDLSFAPDGKTALVGQKDYNAGTSAVKGLDLATGKELARVNFPEKGQRASLRQVSPDGAVVPVWVGEKKKMLLEVWFLDVRTLKVHGKLIVKGDPELFAALDGGFTPDGKRYVALDGRGHALVWDVAERKLERTLTLGMDRPAPRLAISPDGRTLAVGWMPKVDRSLDHWATAPEDLPQPRVSLIDLGGRRAPRVLVAPHGYPGAVAFSPDGKILAFGGAGAVHLFDLRK